jgi:integrase
MTGELGSHPDRSTQATIAAYRPCAVSEGAGAFARQAVGRACPESPARAKALLFCTSRLGAFAEGVGLEPSPEALLGEAVIERFIARGTAGLSPASVRTLRTNLRALARALEAHPQPAPVALPRERAKPPYSPAQIEGYLRLAEAQSTQARRMRATALICLGAGAGIVSGELRQIRGCDVIWRSGGVLVAVQGKRSRIVPVRSSFQAPLAEAATFAGQRLIIGGRDPRRRNISDALCRALCADPSLPRLQAGRLRSTWLDQCAQMIGLQAFMAAAGVSCSQRLGDIAASLPVISEAQMLALLGGSP